MLSMIGFVLLEWILLLSYSIVHQPEHDEHEGGKCVIYNNQSKMCSSVSMLIDLQHNVSFVCMHC